jgi:fructuronate reductase
VPTAVARSVAAWIAYVRAAASGELVVGGRPVRLDDPMAAALTEATAGPLETVVDRVFALRAVFGDELPQSAAFRAAVLAALRTL